MCVCVCVCMHIKYILPCGSLYNSYFINSVIITKKPNYYYAKICVQLLTGNLENALVTINKGIRAIETKEEGTYYYTYFKQRYLLCLIACSLLKTNIKNTNQIIEYFNEVEDLNYILKGRMGYSIHWLKSILSFTINTIMARRIRYMISKTVKSLRFF